MMMHPMQPEAQSTTDTSGNTATADVALIGLGVMGRNLALNLADHGYKVAGLDRSPDAVKNLIDEDRQESLDGQGGRIIGCDSARALLGALKTPRVVIVLVPAGEPVDAVCRDLIDAGCEADDIVVDCGNSRWTDTIRREQEYRGKLTFFGSGVSGGEVGARFGPALMPGGDEHAWARLKPMWEAIAAKVDPETGKPLEDAAPGKPITGGEPCTTYIGADGAGHYVKMVHNGIEYADMQLIAEAYQLLRTEAGLSPGAIGDLFDEWNSGELASYLIEITADILRQADPITGQPIVDVILDRAKMKGTGTWTAINALELGMPTATIAEAVFARGMSALKDERIKAAEILPSPPGTPGSPGSPRQGAGGEGSSSEQNDFIAAVRDALYCSKVCAYAQGFQLMRAAQSEYNWQLNFGEIARIWRGGCIIRAALLRDITDAFTQQPALDNLLVNRKFAAEIGERQTGWRQTVAMAAQHGIPSPAFASALAYYDAYRLASGSANLIQAQRDYFGAHSYQRVDRPEGDAFHLDWTDPARPQIDVT